MKHLDKLYTLVITLCITLSSQSQPSIQALNIGDTVPEIFLKHIVNYSSSSAKFSKFRGKALVLDFWATWCGPCVGGMPKLDSLRKRYVNKAEVFLVSNEGDHIVKPFLKRKPDVNLPVVVYDTVLHYLFPHRSIPHSVLIDKYGKIVSITSPEYITAEVVDQVLSGAPVDIPIKKDDIAFNRELPLLFNDNGGGDDKVLYRSLVSGHLDGISSGTTQLALDNGKVGLSCKNISIPHLYLIAMQKPTMYCSSRLLFENVKDSTRYTRDIVHSDKRYLDQWGKTNTYCFDLITDGSVPRSERLKIMKQTLDNAFKGMYGLEAAIEKRKIKCFVLASHEKGIDSNLVTKYPGSAKTVGSLMDKGVNIFRNVSMDNLASALESSLLFPVINETHYAGQVDLDIPDTILATLRSGRNPKDLEQYIARYGLDFFENEREVEVLVLKEGAK